MNKKRIIAILESLKLATLILLSIYVWTASSHYLFFNVSYVAGNVVFYAGILLLILCLLTSPRIKKVILK